MEIPTLIQIALRYQNETGAEVRIHDFGKLVEIVDHATGVHNFIRADGGNYLVSCNGNHCISQAWLQKALNDIGDTTPVVMGVKHG